MQSKRLVRLLSEKHSNQFFRKVGNEGIISCSAVPLVLLEVGDNANAPTQLRWDTAVVHQLRIDKDAINAQFQQLFLATDTSRWSI